MDDLLAEFERPRQETPEDKERRRRLYSAIGIAGLSLVALGSLTTNALFTDTETTDSAAFVTGTIDLVTTPGGLATVDFNAGNMAPGDTVYGPLEVRNAGSLRLRYSASADATNTDGKDLRDQLDFSVYRGCRPDRLRQRRARRRDPGRRTGARGHDAHADRRQPRPVRRPGSDAGWRCR